MNGKKRRATYAGGALVPAILLLVAIAISMGIGASLGADVGRARAIAWPSISWTLVVSDLNQPVQVTHAADGTGRLFVVERGGDIRIIEEGILLPTPFLSITDRVRSTHIEQGLLSAAFPPDYAEKGHFYVNYTATVGATIVARYQVTDDPYVADPASEVVILTQTQPHPNHNGGQLAFGPDGYLYVGLGDGGGAGDPDEKAQDPSSWLGKLLRVDVEFVPQAGRPFTATHILYLPLVTGGAQTRYRVPATNPFVETEDHRDEIWSLGLRNPWRFSFDSATGDLYIADVGQSSYEEVNFQPAASGGGENYGWNIMEGAHCYPSPPCDQTGLVLPVAEYDHSLGCAVIGGLVYRGVENPAMEGIYFFGDYCSGRIWGLIREAEEWQVNVLAHTNLSISAFGADEAGELYVVDFWRGEIYLLREAE